MLSADKWADPTGSADPLTYGAGYLDIPAALASTATAALPALSPTLTANTDGTISLVMDRAAWGTTTTGGSRAAWGTGLWGTGITDLRAAWGTSLNAASGVAADRATWGHQHTHVQPRRLGQQHRLVRSGRLGYQHGRGGPDHHRDLRRVSHSRRQTAAPPAVRRGRGFLESGRMRA